MVLKQTRYFLRSIAKKLAECPSNDHQPPLNEPISILSLPDTLNYEELVTQAESDLDGLEISVAEDLSTGAHAVTGAVEHQLLHPFPDPSSNSYFPPNNATPPRAEKVSYHHWKRKLKRKKKRDAEDTDCTEPSERTVDQAVRKSKVVRLDLDAAAFDAAKGAHTAKRGTEKSMGAKGEIEKEYSVEELVEMGYTHIPWDGIDPLLILDCKGRIIAFLAGRPNRDDFVDEMMEVFEEMMAVSEEMGWNEETRAAHKRGWFHAFNRGVTMGMGSPTPVALSNGEGIDATLTRLAGSQGFKRLDGYQNSVVKLWAPRLYATYRETVEKMYEKLPHLERSRNFRKSIFAAAAFNFGGHVRTFFHRDHMNWPFGLCAITALGRFDPERSGHLILKPFKIVINFPHASTVAIPSACVTHGNASIAPGDLRMSFTQYTAGAIFCWVENSFQTEQAIKTSDFPRWQEIQNRKKTAVGCRLELYSVVSEILQDTEPIL